MAMNPLVRYPTASHGGLKLCPSCDIRPIPLGSGALKRLADYVLAEHYAGLVNAPSGEGVKLLDTTLGDTAGMLGAAALIYAGPPA